MAHRERIRPNAAQVEALKKDFVKTLQNKLQETLTVMNAHAWEVRSLVNAMDPDNPSSYSAAYFQRHMMQQKPELITSEAFILEVAAGTQIRRPSFAFANATINAINAWNETYPTLKIDIEELQAKTRTLQSIAGSMQRS